MNNTTRLELDEAQRRELKRGYRNGASHCYRMRCLTVLLRADGTTLERVGERTGMGLQAVRNWVGGYKVKERKNLKERPTAAE